MNENKQNDIIFIAKSLIEVGTITKRNDIKQSGYDLLEYDVISSVSKALGYPSSP